MSFIERLDKYINQIAAWIRTGVLIASNPTAVFRSEESVKLLDDLETLEYIQDNRVGIVRFGDGEINYLVGYPTNNEEHNDAIETKLKGILRSYSSEGSPYLLAVPLEEIYSQSNILLLRSALNRIPGFSIGSSYNREIYGCGVTMFAIKPFVQSGEVYGSPFCFRFRKINKSKKEENFIEIKKLLADNEIVYVSDKNYLSPSFSISHFVQIPSTNAFEKYDSIKTRVISKCNQLDDPLVLITAGVTGTVLSAELNEHGIRTMDIGQLNILLKQNA